MDANQSIEGIDPAYEAAVDAHYEAICAAHDKITDAVWRDRIYEMSKMEKGGLLDPQPIPTTDDIEF